MRWIRIERELDRRRYRLRCRVQGNTGIRNRRLKVQRNLEEIVSYMEDRFRRYELFDRQMKRITSELLEFGYSLDEITRGINSYLLHLEPLSSDYRYKRKGMSREHSF
ncbi:MAG: hypothetical protein U9N45_08390, partial [Gemmatimonadota bacterium]|nr:hypothetical protein [Gemmatimonadota bacterium]